MKDIGEKVYDQSAKLSELNIFIDDSANINPMEIRASVQKACKTILEIMAV